MNRVNLKRIIKNLISESTVRVVPELVDLIYNEYMDRIFDDDGYFREDIDEPNKFGFKILELPLNTIFGYTPTSKDLKIGLLAYDYWKNNKRKNKSINYKLYKKFVDQLPKTKKFQVLMTKLKFNLGLKLINSESSFYGMFRTYSKIIFNAWKTVQYLAGSIVINIAAYTNDIDNIDINIKNTISHEIVHFIQVIMSLLIKLGKEINTVFENNTNSENQVYDIDYFIFENERKKFGLSNLNSVTNLRQNNSTGAQDSNFNFDFYFLNDTEYKAWLADIIKNIYNFILNFGRELNLDSNYFNLTAGEDIFKNINKENYFDAANSIIKTLYGDQNPDNAFQIIEDNKNKFSTNEDKSATQLLFLRTNLKHEKRKRTLINDLSVGLQRKFKEELNLNENVLRNKIRNLIREEMYKKRF
jgi:hypothetical protein